MEGFDLAAGLRRFAQGADVFMTIVVVLGVVAEIALMWWAIRTILRVARARRERAEKEGIERLRRR